MDTWIAHARLELEADILSLENLQMQFEVTGLDYFNPGISE